MSVRILVLLFAVSILQSHESGHLIDDFDGAKGLQDWTFSNGSEFPGARGALSLGPGREGRGAILSYDFTCSTADQCGHYVAATWKAPSPLRVNPGAALSLWVRLTPDVRIAIRLKDETGQTLQFHADVPSLEHRAEHDWQPITVPITGQADGHWGGANNGKIMGRVTEIAILADSRYEQAAHGQMQFDDLWLRAAADVQFDLDGAARVTPAPAGAALLRPRLGANIHLLDDDRALDAARDAGFSFVRMDLLWAALEKQGQYNFAPFDGLMQALETRNMGVLWLLDYGHPEHGGQAPQSAEDLRAYARYAAAVVSHFRGHNARFEIWNEPNGKRFLPNPAIYPELLQASLDAIRLNNPSAVVSTGGVSGFDFPFFTRVLESGSARKASAVAVHPYRDSGPESVRPDLMTLETLVRRTVGPNVPVWDTEWGYPSYGYLLKQFSRDGHGDAGRKRQAVLATRECLTVWALGLPVAVWYDLRDDGSNPFEQEQNFGLLSQDNSDKPAMKAIRILGAVARNHTYAGLFPNVPYGIHAMRLDGADDLVFVVWSDTAGTRSYIRIPRKERESVNDLFGEPISAERDEGKFEVFSLEESMGPIYIRLNRR